MSKKRGPRGWKATIWGELEVYAVTTDRASVAGRIYEASRDADSNVRFQDIKVRRCELIDHLPDGFWRECWKEHSSNETYRFSKEDREWMASLREPEARAVRRGAETEVAAA